MYIELELNSNKRNVFEFSCEYAQQIHLLHVNSGLNYS